MDRDIHGLHRRTPQSGVIQFWRELFKHAPEAIVSDRDKIFVSRFWRELFKQVGTKLKYSTAFHPQTDGHTEVTNRYLGIYLRCFVGDHPWSWPKWLYWAELWFNTNYNTSIGMTPYKALYGRDLIPIIKALLFPQMLEEVNYMYEDRDTLLGKLHENLSQAHHRMIKHADKHRREVSLVTGCIWKPYQPMKHRHCSWLACPGV